eukprot:gb/GECH01004631.1/.p1 GENE.gb/GECH01004631.1/~~gb/GECH01004631.1/.p1  ORF type:complete len:372 (+),score=117.03 gb/GECH01004631.1/:1-1116(+)
MDSNHEEYETVESEESSEDQETGYSFNAEGLTEEEQQYLEKRQSSYHVPTSSDEDQLERAEMRRIYEKAREERQKLLTHNLSLQKKLHYHFSAASKKPEQQQKHDDIESTYIKLVNEVKGNRKKLLNLQNENQKQIDENKEKLDQLQNQVAEQIQEYDSKRQNQAFDAKHSRTGNSIPQEEIERLEVSWKAKNEEISKYRIKHIEYRNQIDALNKMISEKEEFSKGLHLIDFEQLKIENSNLQEKIDERNDDLSKLRKKATRTVHILTHVREKLQFMQSENRELKKELSQLDSELNEHKDILNQVKKERDTLKNESMTMRQNMPLVGSEDLLMDYEVRKNEISDLKAKLSELKQQHKRYTETTKLYKNALK